MNLIDCIEEKAGPYFEEFKKRMFPAQVLSRDGEVLPAGQATLESDGDAGVFWPKKTWPKDKPPETVAVLRKNEERHDISVREFHVCQSHIHEHYHFKLLI